MLKIMNAFIGLRMRGADDPLVLFPVAEGECRENSQPSSSVKEKSLRSRS